MITIYDRSDILRIMKMNGFTLIDSDSASFTFHGSIEKKDYLVEVLIVENKPHIKVKKNKIAILSETIKTVDDLKIFLEERLYQYLGQEIN